MTASLRQAFRFAVPCRHIRLASGCISSSNPRASFQRTLQTSQHTSARYERFPSGFPSGSSSGGRQDVLNYLRRRLGGERAVWVYGIAIGGGGIYYVVHLERVPETGRLRFIDVGEAQERELGQQTQLQTLSQYSHAVLAPNHPTTTRVRNVASRIIKASGLGRVKSGGEMGAVEGTVPNMGNGSPLGPGEILFGGGVTEDMGKDTEWEVYVIDDKKTKNAFVLPGGKIFVFTGILPVSANDNGLATVLGHEIAHQVARHPAERVSYMKVLFALSFLLETLGFDVGVTRLLVTFVLQLPNSRKSESEADFIGLRLMSRACFDPSESTKMWDRMSKSESGGGLGAISFLSTHPANAKRIKQLLQWMPEAQQIRAASPCGATSSQMGGFLDSIGSSNLGMGQSLWG
ncbi:MAG: hypothetical protein TREMPRED_000488 [Tremellales sp. Tagirdzhanova-0007]|nr:MAG: hypothetical protein TREMPRED_000488 [Tremellales sp. Tagirdzhanova-0007]